MQEGSNPNSQVYVTYGYENGTRRLVSRSVARGATNGFVDYSSFAWDDAGNLTSIKNAPTDTAAGFTRDTQCFSYDALQHLTRAWTPAELGACSTTPTATSQLGGPAPYWIDWTVDPKTGNRTSQVSHASTGDTTTTYTYPAPGTIASSTSPGPHAVKELSTQVGSAAATKTTFGYDAAGEMTQKTQPTGAATSYSWDKQGRLAGANTVEGTTTQIYDADGNLLIKREPSGTTLYADGGSEIIWNKAANRLDARYTYSPAGQLVGTRNISGADKIDRTSILVADHHGTGELALHSDTLAVTWRRTLPFGEPRGAQSSWVSDRGFVGGIMDQTTGLTQLGVRPYDPVLGRFIIVDPVMSLSDPQQWNAYSYANHSPTTLSDPSGEWTCSGAAACAAIESMMRQQEQQKNYSDARSGVYNNPGGSSSGPSVSTGGGGRGGTAESGKKHHGWGPKWVRKAASFVNEHKAVIVSTVVSVAVGAGCMAVTGGVGSVGCAALAGAAGSAVNYAMSTPPENWSVGGFATEVAMGAATGAAFAGIGAAIAPAAKAAASSAMRAVTPALKAGGTKVSTAASKAATAVRGALTKSKTGTGAAKTAEKEADDALAAGRTSGAAAELRVGNEVFTDVSTGGAPRVLHDSVQEALDAVPASQRAPWHGACAEMGCLSQALKAGVNPAGGSIRAVAIGTSNPGHGMPKVICSSCSAVLDVFGVGR